MEAKALRRIFLNFYKERGHIIVPSSSLVPKDDPTLLFTTAGMVQFKPLYAGAIPLPYKRATSCQKCLRLSDLEKVGFSPKYCTFFEMLGNFSFGGYFKKEAISYAKNFIEKEMGLLIDKVSVFNPQKVPAKDWRKNVSADKDSLAIWQKLGFPKEKIEEKGIDNFWGPTGEEGPCGPTTEIYLKNVSGDSIEVWNLVFNEFYCDRDKKLTPLKKAGVDTGMGLERLAMIKQGVKTVFETDLFSPLIKNLPQEMPTRSKRIMADHLRAVAFLIADGFRPSNKEAGYILRSLIRRIIEEMISFDLTKKSSLAPADIFKLGQGIDIKNLFFKIISFYKDFYPELETDVIFSEFEKENQKFRQTLALGLKKLEKLETINSQMAFDLYQSLGLPFEAIKKFGGEKAKNLNYKDFQKEFKKHQEISRQGAVKKFGGHGLVIETGEIKAENKEEVLKIIRLHTATHLLQQALRDVLGNEVEQRGSDINASRTRFDFSFSRKMTAEEIKKVEEIVNEKIKENLPVHFKILPKKEAEKTGALYFFKAKYPEMVKVYYIGHSLYNAYSKEFCAGPHVSSTAEIGRFKILKEEAVGQGIRRIRATVF